MTYLGNVFEQIYANNVWKYGSGEGSLPLHTQGYVKFLQKFIRKHRVRSVVDLGCGDWQFSRLLDWNGVNYLGLDIVRSVIERNRKLYAKPGITFEVAPEKFNDLPAADLLLAKDVLQHWSASRIQEFLLFIHRYPLALITNCTSLRPRRFWRGTPTTQHRDIQDGDFRRLDIRNAPFLVKCDAVYSFCDTKSLADRLQFRPEKWRKTVLLVKNSPLTEKLTENGAHA
jgi:SAM-dependent methyltransferase